jgi:hypothetical protein
MDNSGSGEVEKHELVSRRLFRRGSSGEPHYVVDDNGKGSYTLAAFSEVRPQTGVSVDIMWKVGSAGQRERERFIAQCSKIARDEGHDIVGWAACRKDTLLRFGKHVVKDVLRTKSKSGENDFHGDIIKKDFLQIAEGDPEARSKAWHVAKVLAEGYTQEGEFLGAAEESGAE